MQPNVHLNILTFVDEVYIQDKLEAITAIRFTVSEINIRKESKMFAQKLKFANVCNSTCISCTPTLTIAVDLKNAHQQ